VTSNGESTAATASGADHGSLAEVRARIDALDDAIVVALGERFSLALGAAAYKGGDVQDKAREAEILSRVERLADELGLDRAAIRSSYVRILELSRELQCECAEKGP
jgi:chorismate mutase